MHAVAHHIQKGANSSPAWGEIVMEGRLSIVMPAGRITNSPDGGILPETVSPRSFHGINPPWGSYRHKSAGETFPGAELCRDTSSCNALRIVRLPQRQRANVSALRMRSGRCDKTRCDKMAMRLFVTLLWTLIHYSTPTGIALQ